MAGGGARHGPPGRLQLEEEGEEEGAAGAGGVPGVGPLPRLGARGRPQALPQGAGRGGQAAGARPEEPQVTWNHPLVSVMEHFVWRQSYDVENMLYFTFSLNA